MAASFFQTGPGQYGEGDKFLGIRVPQLREVAREFRTLSLRDLRTLLDSEWHEARLLALVILGDQYAKAEEKVREEIFEMYLANTARINSWDLVDVSAPKIVGPHLRKKGRALLRKLAKSKVLWERRIAIIATQHFIRNGEFDDTLRIAEILLGDKHDLIHKAVGWMLREVGDRDRALEQKFLDQYAARMPRTMLRYAIEKFPEPLRRKYMTM